MKTLIGLAVLAASIPLASPAHAAPSPGDSCVNWHATTTGPNGQTMTCTHLPQSDPSGGSGHIVYWEYGGARDMSYRTSGFKTAPTDDWYGFGSGQPCNSNDVKVIKVTERGNAIEQWGPKGCDPGLPMTGTN